MLHCLDIIFISWKTRHLNYIDLNLTWKKNENDKSLLHTNYHCINSITKLIKYVQIRFNKTSHTPIWLTNQQQISQISRNNFTIPKECSSWSQHSERALSIWLYYTEALKSPLTTIKQTKSIYIYIEENPT